MPADLSQLLAELRETRGQAEALAGRIAGLERRLRAALKDH